MTDLELIDYDERWNELERREMFRTSDPAAIKQEALRIAAEWAPLVSERRLSTNIGRSRYVLLEGWTLLAAMAGCSPIVQWVKPTPDGDGYIARVEVFDREGRLVSAAEAMCEHAEGHWAKRDNHALWSMCQTRAISKALRNKLGFVITLEGYEATPAEEMPPVVEQPPQPKPAAKDPTLVEERQTAEIFRLLEELDALDPATDWAAWCREYAGVPFHKIDKIGADRVIVGLMEKVHDLSPPTRTKGVGMWPFGGTPSAMVNGPPWRWCTPTVSRRPGWSRPPDGYGWSPRTCSTCWRCPEERT